MFEGIRKRFSIKESRVMQSVINYWGNRAQWTPVNYEQYAREGYQTNIYVYACIRQISMACAGIPWLLYNKSGKNKDDVKEIENHDLLTLLARPNPLQGTGKFIENIIGYLMISGNSYIEAVGPDNKTAPPKELYVLRPDRIQVVPGNSLQPIGSYQYEVGGIITNLPSEKVLHLKFFNPLNDWYGMAPLQAAARSVDQNNESKAWNVGLLQNFARPSGVLKTDGTLSEEQFNRLQLEMTENWAGGKNAGRPKLLEGGLDWQETGLSPEDMSWLEGMKLTAREIAIAYGVPPELIGDNANKTYSNYAESRLAFYQETILPLMDWLRDELNNWLVPLFGENLYLDYDKDEIEALSEDRQVVWDRCTNAWFLTLSEVRLALGYEEDNTELGAMYKFQIDQQSKPAEPPSEAPVEEPPVVEEPIVEEKPVVEEPPKKTK